MRSTKAGAIIGQALEGFDGEGIGKVTVFIKTSYGLGSGIADLAEGVDPSSADFGKNVLSTLMTDSDKLIAQQDLSEVFADRVVAGLELITPKITTDRVAVNSIETSTAENIEIKNSVTINGTLTVDKIKANQIEGLEVLTNKIGRLELASGEVAKGSTARNESVGSAMMDLANLQVQNLSVALNLNLSGGLIVNGLAQFNGESVFDKLVTFSGKTLFKDAVDFEGRTTFNNDTGGFAAIKKDNKEIEVRFSKPYDEPPVITISIRNGVFATYSYKEIKNAKTQEIDGFTIILKEPAEEEVEFSWTAMSIKDARLVHLDVSSNDVKQQ